MTRWTAEQDDRLRRLWADGVHVRVIGKRLGCGMNAIYDRVKALDLPPRASRTVVEPARGPVEAGPRPRGCQWIEGDTAAGMCGAPVDRPGSAWCAAHRARVYVPVRSKRPQQPTTEGLS